MKTINKLWISLSNNISRIKFRKRNLKICKNNYNNTKIL